MAMGLGKRVVSFGLVLVVVVVASFAASFSLAVTDPRDVKAINMLYTTLNNPTLRGWVPFGGDPCEDGWQGVSCVFSNITALKLDGMNLGGTLGNGLELFNSILEIDLSNNHIGGSIPSGLPATVMRLSLASNQFNGSIPADILSSLSRLIIISLKNNLLSGEIPDSFQQQTSLTNLDLSGNNLSGQLPPSLGNLSSLSSLYMQNNKLTGTLDVLQDLSLQDLNVENNLFSGPIPAKLLTIPNFRKDGNPFNTTIISLPPAAAPPSLPPQPVPSSMNGPSVNEPSGNGPSGNRPSASDMTKTGKSRAFFPTKRIILIVVLGTVIVIILGVCLLSSACCRKKKFKEDTNRQDSGAYKSHTEKPNRNSSMHPSNQEKTVPKGSIANLQDKRQPEVSAKAQVQKGTEAKRMAAYSSHKTDHKIEATGKDVNHMPVQPQAAHFQTLPADKAVVSLSLPLEVYTGTKAPKSPLPVKLFTIGKLQQYTNSFSEENFVGEGTFGRVYGAELPDGKFLAVKKLSTAWEQTNEEFAQLVSFISTIRHANIVDLVGYCNEHGQRLLVYEYCENGTLHDALHVDSNIHKKLAWNTRIQLAIRTAKALQYLHEVCQPPIVHQNFRSTNILLDDNLDVKVSDCGFPPVVSFATAAELSGHHLSAYSYSAPECESESGSYTCKSDIYSFGVVMLELFTGRKTYDRSRPRAEQYLVRWAVPQLYDIDALRWMVDPSLGGEFPIKSLSRLADTISRCLQVLYGWMIKCVSSGNLFFFINASHRAFVYMCVAHYKTQWDPEFRPAASEIVQDLLHMM